MSLGQCIADPWSIPLCSYVIIEAMCESLRLMSDFQSREIEENRDMKMAAMFGHGNGQR